VVYGGKQKFTGGTLGFGKPHRREPFEDTMLTWSSQGAVIVPKRLAEVREAKYRNPAAAKRYRCTFSTTWLRELSCILTFLKDKAADAVEGGAHHNRFQHVGDNDNGVNVSYEGEQNFENVNISFG
jgi:hypothetical protein